MHHGRKSEMNVRGRIENETAGSIPHVIVAPRNGACPTPLKPVLNELKLPRAASKAHRDFRVERNPAVL